MDFLGVFMPPKTFASGAAPRIGPFSKNPHLLSISEFGGLAPLRNTKFAFCLALSMQCVITQNASVNPLSRKK